MAEYSQRDIMALDRQGNYYSRHLSAMTGEQLHDKSDIAAELAWRDAKIDQLRAHLADIANPITKLQREASESDCKLDGHQARILANDAHWLQDLARLALIDTSK
ncbi:hypothetical protein [Halomonas sp. BMC6]|uniref:hypothetical protein n=1 Tax=Halomonas sp. BMC6 TaxID=3073244 RepID=UPI0030D354BB